MFRYEKDMIPVLINNLSKLFNTGYFITEFGTGNGVADIVFTTGINKEPIVLNDYYLMSTFINYFNKKHKIRKELILNRSDIKRVKYLIGYLLEKKFIEIDNDFIKINRPYKAQTKDLFSIEAKLNDWKSGYYQALRYTFFSNKTFLALPSKIIHRVDLDLLKNNKLGLISVNTDSIDIILNPRSTKPKDSVSYYHLSESFVSNYNKN